MSLPANAQCFDCGWAFHVSPRQQSAARLHTLHLVCPACGSDTVVLDADDLPFDVSGPSCSCQSVSTDARDCDVHGHSLRVKAGV